MVDSRGELGKFSRRRPRIGEQDRGADTVGQMRNVAVVQHGSLHYPITAKSTSYSSSPRRHSACEVEARSELVAQ